MPFVFADFTGAGFAETRNAGFTPAGFGRVFFGAATFFPGFAGFVVFTGFTGLAAFTGLRAGAFFGAGLRATGFFAGCVFFAGFAGFFFATGFAAVLRLLVAISCHHCPSAVACYSLSRPVHQQLIYRPPQVTRIILALIAIYKSILSPLFGPRCRFHPSCSDYARAAVSRFGAGRGGLLALWRIARCQPLCAGGIDPVPDKFALPTCRHKEFPA